MGKYILTIGEYEKLNTPTGLIQLSDGNIGICDKKNNCIKIFNLNGEYLDTFGSYNDKYFEIFDEKVPFSESILGVRNICTIMELSHNRIIVAYQHGLKIFNISREHIHNITYYPNDSCVEFIKKLGVLETSDDIENYKNVTILNIITYTNIDINNYFSLYRKIINGQKYTPYCHITCPQILYNIIRFISYIKNLYQENVRQVPNMIDNYNRNITDKYDGYKLFKIYYEYYKNYNPVTEIDKIPIDVKIIKSLNCSPNMIYRIYHIYLTDNLDHILHPEYNPLLKEPNNRTTEYIPLYLRLDQDIQLLVNSLQLDNIECSNTETLVYVCTLSYTQTEYDKLIDFLRVFNTKPIYDRDIILINDTNQYVLDASDYSNFRKVVNCKKTMLQSYDPLHTDIDNAMTTDFKFLKYDARVYLGKKSFYIYEYFFPNKELSNKVTDKWWYTYFIRSLSCSRNRLIQFGGTCWFNTILNTLLLTEPIKKWLKNKLIYNPRYDTFFSPIIGHIDNTSNSSPPKTTFNFTLDEKITDLISGEERDMYNILMRYDDISSEHIFDPILAFLYGKINYNLELDDRNINDLSKLIVSKSKGGGNAIRILRLLNILDPDNEYYETVHLTNIYTLNDGYKLLNKITDSIELATKEMIIFYGIDIYIGNYSLAKSIIRSDETTYKLYAVSFGTIKHVIVGLMCKDIPYIYDSNNIIAKTDWTVFDFSGYHKKVMELTYKHIKMINYIYCISYIIYIRDV